MEPRKVVGTVDTAEFLVAFAASVGFLISLSFTGVPWGIVGALLLGGLIAAPIAAWIVRHLNARILGTTVGGFILLINARTFLEAVGLNPNLNTFVYLAILAVWGTALYFAITAVRKSADPVLDTSS
ncbi:MAG: TSUP family transporter, partial [Rubrobacter sp.]